jgi:hypothetical protein
VRDILRKYAGKSVEKEDTDFINQVTSALGARGSTNANKTAIRFIRENFPSVTVEEGAFHVPASL